MSFFSLEPKPFFSSHCDSFILFAIVRGGFQFHDLIFVT